MREPEFNWYGNLLDQNSVTKYIQLKKNQLIPIKFKNHLYKVQMETEKAIKLKPEFDKLRNEDYSKALDWWHDHFHFTQGGFFFPPDNSDLSTRDMMKLYPNHYLSCLPKTVNGKEDPRENEIYIHWYMKHFLEMFPEYNSKTRIEAIEKDLKLSTNPILFLETELTKIEDHIDYNYRGKPSKVNGSIHGGGMFKIQKQLFEDLDFRGKEPDWTKVGSSTAQKFLDAKCLIEYREYLKSKLEDIKTQGIKAKEQSFEKIQWNANTNELVFLFKVLGEFQVNGKPLLEIGGGSKTANFLFRNMIDKDGKNLGPEGLKTTFKTTRIQSLPKDGQIDWSSLFQFIKDKLGDQNI